MKFRFTVYGEPVGKGRPRFTKQGRAYTPKKTKDYESKVRSAYIDAGGAYYGDETLDIHVEAYFKMPTAWSKKKRAEMDLKPCTKLPDADNVLKSILDGLQGVCYENDKTVTSCSIDKHWSDQSLAVIWIDTAD